MENVKITLVRSLIACKPNQKKTARCLGFRKIGDFETIYGTTDQLFQIGLV